MKKITSIKNPLIQELLLLHYKKYRNIKKIFLIEGEHLIYTALLKKKITSIFIDENYLYKYKKILNNFNNIKIIIVNYLIIKKISQYKTPQPIIAVCIMIKPLKCLHSNNIILIDTIQDPGNLGNILRIIAAFNISEIYLTKNSVDLYNHKVISASQGAIFYINVYYKDFDNFLLKIKNQNYIIYGTFLHKNNSINLSKIKLKKKNAFLFGNEGNGINKKYLNQINQNIFIPTSLNVESLNLAVSVAIVTYHLFNNKILK